jgi:CBS domain-containing protein
MVALRWLAASAVAFASVTGAFAGVHAAAASDSDKTSAAVAALKASLGNGQAQFGRYRRITRRRVMIVWHAVLSVLQDLEFHARGIYSLSSSQMVPHLNLEEGTMLCRDIMKTNVECVSPLTTAGEAARRMRDQNVGFLPVCGEHMQALGTVTDRDIAVRLVAEGRPLDTPVDLLMTTEVVACRPEDELDHARDLMAQSHKSRIICINREGRIEGVISLSDIAQIDDLAGAVTLHQVSERESRGDSGNQLGLM